MPRRFRGGKNNGSSNGPLRKIVGWVDVPLGVFYGKQQTVKRQLLECGHTKPEGRDIFGPTNADKRRCRKCKAGAPPDVVEPSPAAAAKEGA